MILTRGLLMNARMGVQRLNCCRKLQIYLFISWLIGFLMSEMKVVNYFGTNNNEEPNDEFLNSKEFVEYKKHYNFNATVANQLFKDVRVLCWIMTNPLNHQKKARHVKRTWGTHCNKLIFMSSAEDQEIGSVALPVSEGRDNLWAKTKEAFKYIHKHHLDDADWFLKADDDTFVIVENLRYMLYPYDKNSPLYFGCRFQPFVKQGYMSGGAGYVLSRESVRRFVENALPHPNLCLSSDQGTEDVEMGKCLENVGVEVIDSRDSFGHSRFFPFPPSRYFQHLSKKESWFLVYQYYNSTLESMCCAQYGITFHYIHPEDMYLLEYLIYYLNPFGIQQMPDVLVKNKIDSFNHNNITARTNTP